MTIGASARSIGIIDLGRVARGFDELADIAGHGPLRTAHGTTLLGAASRAEHSIGRVIDSLAEHQPAAEGVAHLRAATAHLDDAVAEITPRTPWPRRFMPFLSRGWDARSSVTHLRAGASELRLARESLAWTPGVHRYSEQASQVLLRGPEREAALSASAARAPIPDRAALPPRVSRYVDATGIGQRQSVARRMLESLRGLHHTTWIGREHIPPTGSAIVLGTHGSYADPLLVGLGIPRETHLMADKVVARLLGKVGEKLGAYPVDRAGGPAAAEAKQVTETLLDEGKLVHMYPDGGIVRLKSTIPEPKSGAAVFGLRTGAPIVPSASFGINPKFARWDITGSGRYVVYGEPMVFRRISQPTAEQIAEVRELIAAESEDLLHDAQARFEAAAH